MDKKALIKLAFSLGILTVFGVFSAGCSKRYSNLPAFSAFPIHDSFNHSVGRFKTSYLADQIHAYYRGHTSGPIGVATFVDIDNLYGTSTFGRFIGEQLMSELVMRGYNVIEVRKADALQIMFGQGEFGLSRELSALAGWQDLAGLVVGTYTTSPVRVYLNARLVDPRTSLVISAGSIEMRKTKEIARMLRNNSLPPTLERIPVRHLGYSTQPIPNYWPYMIPRTPGRMYDYEEDQMYSEPDGDTTDVPAMPEKSMMKEQSPPEPKLEPNA